MAMKQPATSRTTAVAWVCTRDHTRSPSSASTTSVAAPVIALAITEDASTPVIKLMAPAHVVTYDRLASVIDCVTPALDRHFANVAMQTFDDSAIESSALIMEFVAPEFAAICASPAPASDHVASALAVTTTTPTPAIGYMAVSPAVTNDGPLSVIGYVAPTTQNVAVSPAVTNDGPLPVIEFMAPALGAFR